MYYTDACTPPLQKTQGYGPIYWFKHLPVYVGACVCVLACVCVCVCGWQKHTQQKPGALQHAFLSHRPQDKQRPERVTFVNFFHYSLERGRSLCGL